jgi:hypothetical protein
MNQKPSLREVPQFVSKALTPNIARGKNNGVCHPSHSDWGRLSGSKSRGAVDISCERSVGRDRGVWWACSSRCSLGNCGGRVWIRCRITISVYGSRSDASSCSLWKAVTACPNGDRPTATRSTRGAAQLATRIVCYCRKAKGLLGKGASHIQIARSKRKAPAGQGPGQSPLCRAMTSSSRPNAGQDSIAPSGRHFVRSPNARPMLVTKRQKHRASHKETLQTTRR